MKAEAASPEPSPLSREEEQAEIIRRLEEDIIFGRFAPMPPQRRFFAILSM